MVVTRYPSFSRHNEAMSDSKAAGAVAEFEGKLDRLAEVAIRAGLGLAPGQELVMTATLDSLPLARRITKQAYKAGASLVTTLLTDEDATLVRFRNGQDASFDTAPAWLYEGMAQALDRKSTRLNSSHMSESRMPSSA